MNNIQKSGNKYIIFILSYGRPDNVKTLKTLNRLYYSGDYRIICSDDDPTIKQYQKNFPNKILIFNKDEVAKSFDTGDNQDDKRTVVFARNSCWHFAKQIGYKYFFQFDDDYYGFFYRVDNNGLYNTRNPRIKNINPFLDIMFHYFLNMNAHSLCMAQAGDFLGGRECTVFTKGLHRKAMNSFLCSTDRPFKFMGRINEDVSTYVNLGSKGYLFFTFCEFELKQETTQGNDGGMTDTYKAEGTYVKSFFSVMYNPSCVKIGLFGEKNLRLHHKIKWENAVPKIMDEKFKKIR